MIIPPLLIVFILFVVIALRVRLALTRPRMLLSGIQLFVFLIILAVPARASFTPFNTSVNANIGIGTSTPQGAFVVTNGNVGVGTWAPAAGIDVATIGNGNSRFGGNVGIGTATGNLVNNLAVQGKVAIGSAAYAGTAGPSNGLVVSGNVGVGSLSPGQALDVNGRARMIGIGTTVAGSLVCIKTDGTLGYCTGTVSGYQCTTCN